jgi:hypothetical protein
MGRRSSRSLKRGAGRIWTIDANVDYITDANGNFRPNNGIGEAGDFAYEFRSGVIWGPKVLRGDGNSSAWPMNPSSLSRATMNAGYGHIKATDTIINNGVARTRVFNGGVEGQTIGVGNLHTVSAQNTWNATAGGWRIRQFMYNQWGDTYTGAVLHKGGSLYFKVKKLPAATKEMAAGLGYQYGTMQPGVVINSAGTCFWRNANHGTTIGTVAVNDEIYLSGVNGKYDCQIIRAGAVIATSVSFYTTLGDYTLAGVCGFGMETTGPSDAEAGCVSDITMIAGF